MNLYGNRAVDMELKLRIGTRDSFTYEEVMKWYSDGLLEDYDLFKVSSDRHNGLYVYHKGSNFYLITASNHIRQIDPQLLAGRSFVVASGSITNNVQHIYQVKGTEAVEGLTDEEMVKYIMGSDYREPVTMDLSDIAKSLGIDEAR